jgi:hypothetical protein
MSIDSLVLREIYPDRLSFAEGGTSGAFRAI